MSQKKKKKEKDFEELAKEWCTCPVCRTKYLCEDGECPKCKK